MSPRTLLVHAQDDLEQLSEVPTVRLPHFNRLHVQMTGALRSLKRIEDDPAHHWHVEDRVAV